MTIEQIDRIDIIGIERSSGIAVLTISDHLDWNQPAVHLAMLDQKVDYYIESVRSEGLVHEYPQVRGRKLAIHLRCKHVPPDTLRAALTSLGQRLQALGMEFRIDGVTYSQ